MEKTIACLIARTVSKRLPLKVLRHIYDDVGMLDFMLQRLKLVSNIDQIYLCTSYESVDDILEDVAIKNNIKLYRGSPESVIERMMAVGKKEDANHIIRITGDNVFTSFEYIAKQIEVHTKNDLDYTRIIGVPIGASAEVMKFSAVRKCYYSMDPAVSEYLLLYMFDPSQYRCGVLRIKGWEDYSSYSLTVDVNEDLARTRTIISHYNNDPLKISLKSIIEIIQKFKVDNSIFEPHGIVKMPYGKEITFANFQQKMTNRINNALLFGIEEIL